jgi:glycerol-3-phosphate dehydrogenase
MKLEYACTAVDILARRTRLAFLDTKAAQIALPRVVSYPNLILFALLFKTNLLVLTFIVQIELMAETLKWDAKRKAKEEHNALKFLETMHVK